MSKGQYWVAVTTVVALIATLSGCGSPRPAVDLTGVEEAIRYELKASQETGDPLVYNLHNLEVTSGGWLALTLDLQAVPPTREAISNDARLWAGYVAHQQVDGEFVKDLFDDHVRVSLLTVFEPDNILRWGSYRYSTKDWDPAEGYNNFDQLTSGAR